MKRITYRLEGLDCAQCAANVEQALRKTDGLDETRVSFATGSIVLDPAFEERAREVIARIEPDLRLVSKGDGRAGESAGGGPPEHAADGSAGLLLRELRSPAALRAALSAVLLAAGLLLGGTLRRTYGAFAGDALLVLAYIPVGWPVLRSAARNIIHGRVFDEMFLMSVATLGAVAIGEIPEAVAVMLFYSVGEFFQELAVNRSRRSIAALMNLRPDTARILDGGVPKTVRPESVSIGRIAEVLPGERIPLDGEVVEGESFVNTSALTGESVPRGIGPGDEVLAGFVNDGGRIRIRVTRRFAESSVAKILELVENAASRKAPTEKFISRFAAVYTPIVVGLAAAVAVLPPLLVPGAESSDWIYRALVILVISCPCALVVSIPLGYFGGIGGASRSSILVKGANYLDALKDVDTLVLDKTGTLTKGVFRVTRIEPRGGFTAEDLLATAAFAESHSNHPIARSIREAYGEPVGGAAPGGSEVEVYEERKGYGIIARIDGKRVLAGNDRLLHLENIPHSDCGVEGTTVYVAVDGTFAGYIVISDERKEEAAEAVQEMKRLGVRRVLMLTGDNEHIAAGVARDIGLDGYYADLLPEEKVAKIEEIRADAWRDGLVAFVGDGINDAPVIMRSDIGFAMGALGSDAAIEAADVVLMDDSLHRVPQAIRIARFTRRVVLQNIALALGVKIAFVILGAVGIAGMWEAVIGDMGVALAAVLNATRTLGFARGVRSGDPAEAPKAATAV